MHDDDFEDWDRIARFERNLTWVLLFVAGLFTGWLVF